MPTTLASPPSSTRSTFPTHEPDEDWPTGATIELRREVQQWEAEAQRQPDEYVEPRRRWWILDAARRDAVLGSDAAFLVSVAISWVLSGVLAYFYARWTIGPVS
jgi:hypothetical protein